MGLDKQSFPPLLGPGRHKLTVDQLRSLCVDQFHASQKRPQLFAELLRLIEYLKASALPCQLWVNGSFVCDKEEPDDIDIAVEFYSKDADKIDQLLWNDLVNNLNGRSIFSPVLDTYLCPLFAREDPRRPADLGDYWAGKWGKGRDDWLKGFVVIGMGESHVQHQLTA